MRTGTGYWVGFYVWQDKECWLHKLYLRILSNLLDTFLPRSSSCAQTWLTNDTFYNKKHFPKSEKEMKKKVKWRLSNSRVFYQERSQNTSNWKKKVTGIWRRLLEVIAAVSRCSLRYKCSIKLKAFLCTGPLL